MKYKKFVLGVLCITLSASIFMACTSNDKIKSNFTANESSKNSIVAVSPESGSSNASDIKDNNYNESSNASNIEDKNATEEENILINSSASNSYDVKKQNNENKLEETRINVVDKEDSDYKLAEIKPDEVSTKYINEQYGFNYFLPKSWNNYSIVTDKWEGRSIDSAKNGKVTQTGPLLYIRHPLWKKSNPRQDIPIMVFTHVQWKLVQNEKIAVSAAPIPPTEICRNSKYVFALPARYNYAFNTGYEEVDSIIKSNFMHPIEGWR